MERDSQKWTYRQSWLKETGTAQDAINYSTSLMRVEGGFKHIETAIKNLEEAHALHIRHYGSDNSDRLTGHHETSSMYKFSYSVGGRNTSIRIPFN